MGEELTYFSTEEADTKFLNLFVITATSTLETGNYDKANTLYSNLGEAWHEAEQGLAAMSAAEGAHEPAKESSLEADLKFAVEDRLKLLWDSLKPKLRARHRSGVQQVRDGGRGAGREGAARGWQQRASWCRRTPHGLVLGQANGSHERDAEW